MSRETNPSSRGDIIDKAVKPLLSDDTLQMSTLMTRIEEVRDWLNPHIVKVVADQKNFALYFSRSPIPFPRDLQIGRLQSHPFGTDRPLPKRVFKHIGVYVFRRKFLLQFSKMKPTPLEKLEKLEQLRALENGWRIKVALVDYEPICVDTPGRHPKSGRLPCLTSLRLIPSIFRENALRPWKIISEKYFSIDSTDSSNYNV